MSGRKWTDEEIEYLGYVVGKQSYQTIAKILKRSVESVKHKAYTLDLQEKVQHKTKQWSEEEIRYIRKHYKKKSAESIAKHLNRTVDSVKHAASRYNASNLNLDGLSLSVIADAFDCDLCVIKRWVNKYDMPAKKRKVGKNTYYDVYGDKFWEWALKHRELIPIDKYKRGCILPEPDELFKVKEWGNKPDNHRKSVTKRERDYMIFLKENGMNYTDISKRVGRTEDSVKHILFDSVYR